MDFRSPISLLGVPLVTEARALTVTAPLTGGGNLSADRTLGLSYDTTLTVSGGALGVSSLVALASHTHTPAAIGAEPALGSPGTSGYVLSSTSGGVRSWAPQGAFSGILASSQGGTGVNNGSFTLTIPATGTAALLNVAQTFSATNTFSAGLNVGTATGAGLGQLNIASSGANTYHLKFSGAEAYQPANSGPSTEGVSATLQVNRAGNKQIYIRDTALAANSTNAMFRLMIMNNIAAFDVISTDQTTQLPLTTYGGLNVGSATGAGAGAIYARAAANDTGFYHSPSAGVIVGSYALTTWPGASCLRVTGGLNIGSADGATAGQIKASSNLTAGTSSVNIGTHPGYDASFGAIWRDSDNYALLFDTTNTFVNSRSGGIYFRDNNVDRAVLNSTGLSVAGALLVNGNYVPYALGGPITIDVQQSGTAATWYGRIATRNANGKAAFLGTYGASVAGVFAHNSDLTQWADLYVNTVNGSVGGNVRLPAATYINGSLALHAGNTDSVLSAGGDAAPGANKLVRTQANGYTFLYYINSTSPVGENNEISQVITTNSYDNYYRKSSIGQLTAAVQANASGTWNITATSVAANLSPATASLIPSGANLNDYPPGFFYQSSNASAAAGSNYPTAEAGSLLSQYAAGGTQLYTTYSQGSDMYFRSNYYGWGAWRKLLHTGNIGSYGYQTASGSVAYATSAGYATYLWSTSHAGSYYVSAAWTGAYWNLTSNHGAPVSCGYATSAGSATTANRANYLNTLHVADMNTILPAGIYQAYAPANAPNTWHWHWLQMPYQEGADGYAAQIAVSLYTDTMMFRSQTSTDWGVWREVLHSGNIGEAWRSDGIQTGWGDYSPSAGYNPFGFWKDAMGVVHLRGLITRAGDNTGQTVIAHLPGGYIPPARELHVCMTSSGPLRVDVDTDQGGYCNIVMMGTLPTGGWVSLDGFTFRTT